MITKEQEIELVYQLIANSSHFVVGSPKDTLYVHSYGSQYEVSWKEILDGVHIESFKEFLDAREAATFFIEKLYHIKESQV